MFEKSGNISEVSIISDFDPDGSPVRTILQGIELTEITSCKIKPLQQPAAVKPIRRDQNIPQNATVSSTGSSSDSDENTDQALADDLRQANERTMPWCVRSLCKMAVARPHLRTEVMWSRLVGKQHPTEHQATSFVQAVKTARWAHKKALDALTGKIAKIY